jgi:hypothetical protein
VALSVTNAVEGVSAGYHRLYIPAALSGDSQYSLRSGQDVRLELVETGCERQVLVVLPTPLEVDRGRHPARGAGRRDNPGEPRGGHP